MFGPFEENAAISGAGLVARTVLVWYMAATGFLYLAKNNKMHELLG